MEKRHVPGHIQTPTTLNDQSRPLITCCREQSTEALHPVGDTHRRQKRKNFRTLASNLRNCSRIQVINGDAELLRLQCLIGLDGFCGDWSVCCGLIYDGSYLCMVVLSVLFGIGVRKCANICVVLTES
jgi:hypothetical protein